MDTMKEVFRLYGRINGVLKKDEKYNLLIDNKYDNKMIYGGKKRLYLQEINELGGSNIVLGSIFMATAIILIIIQIVFLILHESQNSKGKRQ